MKESFVKTKIKNWKIFCALGFPALLVILKYYNQLGRYQSISYVNLAFYGFIAGAILYVLTFEIIKNKAKQEQKEKGRQFEKEILSLFGEFGYKVQMPTRGPDYGADLVIEKDGIKKVIQVKYSFSKNIGLKAVNEVFAAKEKYKASQGIVITNQDFTRQAKHLAEEINVRLLRGVDYKGVIQSKQV